jgi:predicted transcriptional regulator
MMSEDYMEQNRSSKQKDPSGWSAGIAALVVVLLLLACGVFVGLLIDSHDYNSSIKKITDAQEIRIKKIMDDQEVKTLEIVHREVNAAVAAAIEDFKNSIDKSCHDYGVFQTEKYRLPCILRHD